MSLLFLTRCCGNKWKSCPPAQPITEPQASIMNKNKRPHNSTLSFSAQQFNMSDNNSDQQSFAIPALPKKPQQVPAQQQEEENKPTGPPPIPKLNYEKPSWGGVASFAYRLEVLKNGQSIETIEGPKKDFVTIGRLPVCDILMEHPVSFSFSIILDSHIRLTRSFFNYNKVSFSISSRDTIRSRRRCLFIRHG